MLLSDTAAADILALARQNPINAALLDRLPCLGLSDCWLVAGCIFGTVWNVRSGRPPAENIRDYDVFYCDHGDLSYEAEDRIIKRVDAAFADLKAPIEVRNQARVHLWYERRFGRPYAALEKSTDGVDRFLVCGTCIAIRCVANEPQDVYATYDVADLDQGLLRPNPLNHAGDRFLEKALSYKARWPRLTITEPAV